MKKLLKKFYLFLGLIVFVWIVKDIDFIKLKEVIFTINYFPYALAAFLWLPVVLLKTYRWKKIMDNQRIFYSLKDAFLIYGSSSLLGLITPGKIGDFSKIAHLTKDRHSFGRAFLGSFLERVFDLLFVIIFSAIALFALPNFPNFNFNYYSLIKFAAILGFILSIFVILFYLFKKEIFYNFIFEIIKDLKQFQLKDTLFVFFLSIAVWFLYFLLTYLIAISINLHQHISFFYLSFASAISILAGFAPITVAGIGTREAVFIFLLTPLGITKEAVVVFSLLILVNYLALFAINFYCWIKKPLTSPNSSETTCPKKFPV